MRTIIFASIFLHLSLGSYASELDGANDVQRKVAIKLQALDPIFGAFGGGVDVRLSQALGLISSLGYYRNTLGLYNFNLDKTGPGESHLFGGVGLKWIFSGIALKNSFYTAGRMTIDHKNSDNSSQLIILPGAIVGYEWVHDIGLAVDFYLGLNIWGLGSKFGFLPLPTAGLGIGWAV